MFSLAVVDKLTTGDLNDGEVRGGYRHHHRRRQGRSIGGITHKMLAAQEAGATVFLVPADNCEEAKTADDDGHGTGEGGDPRHAVDALQTLSAGGEPPRC